MTSLLLSQMLDSHVLFEDTLAGSILLTLQIHCLCKWFCLVVKLSILRKSFHKDKHLFFLHSNVHCALHSQ